MSYGRIPSEQTEVDAFIAEFEKEELDELDGYGQRMSGMSSGDRMRMSEPVRNGWGEPGQTSGDGGWSPMAEVLQMKVARVGSR